MITAPGDFLKQISRGKSHTTGHLRQEEKMKIISGVLGVLMLTLLPLTSHAKTVHMAKMSIDLIKGAINLDSLDALIKANHQDIDDHFKISAKNPKGDLTLNEDEAFIIRGGQGSIGAKLDQYKTKNIILNNARNWQSLVAYGCYVKNPVPYDNVTYVFVMSAEYKAPSFCKAKSKAHPVVPG